MPVKIISNKPYTISDYWQKLLKSRYLIKILTKREIKIKYSRTLIGIGWLFLQPIVVVTIYTVFFKNFIKLNTEDIPYPQFVLSGLVLWYLFTGIISKCIYALIESGDLISKVSFPKIIVLFSKVIPVFIECFVLLIMAFLIVLFTHGNIGLNSFFVIFYFIQTSILAFGIGMICSIVVLKFRDLAHAIPFIINFAIWLTPVFYSVTIVPNEYKSVLRYGNPLFLSIEGLRNSLFNNQGITPDSIILFGITILIFIISSLIFVKFEKRIVERL